MRSVALTGNVAAGKSAVSALWVAEGVPVVSADELARRAVEPGSSGLDAVRETFGQGVIASDGSLDRGALRSRVFGNEEARKRLEAIVHPRVWALREAWMRERREAGDPLVVAEIPLLFETGREADFDVVVLVDAPAEVRLGRLVETRGLAEDEARRIIAAQMDPAEKRRRADIVIDNAASLDALRARAAEVLDEVRQGLATPLSHPSSGARGPRIRMDLHLHTDASWDCLSDPYALLDRAERVGLGRIAMTDHNRLDVALRMWEEFPERVVPGEEVKTAEGIDVIGLYLTEEIPKGTPARETIERVRAQGGIPYLPHPYASGKGGGGKYAEDLAPLCDVVEVFNARLHPGRLNAPAHDLAGRHGKRRGVGSDAHTIFELGGAWVDLPMHPNRPEALLAALAEGVVEGRTASNLVHLASTWAKLRKKLPR